MYLLKSKKSGIFPCEILSNSATEQSKFINQGLNDQACIGAAQLIS